MGRYEERRDLARDALNSVVLLLDRISRRCRRAHEQQRSGSSWLEVDPESVTACHAGGDSVRMIHPCAAASFEE